MSTILDLPVATDRSASISGQQRLAVLIAFIVAAMISVEGASRVLHQHRAVTRQIESGIQDALHIRHQDNSTQVLFAGNSLIHEGIDKAALQQSVGKYWIVHISGIPGSTFYDWQYGLRSLFQRGSRPQIVVFAISPSQILRGPATTALPVARLWTSSAIIRYSHDYKINLTEVSNMVLEHFSTFFYFRDTVRIYIRKFIPGYVTLANDWLTTPPAAFVPATEGDGAANAFRAKLSALQSICAAHGAKLVFLVVPTHKADDNSLDPLLKSAAGQLDIPVIEPVGEREWPLDHYREDGYHLTPQAAIIFSHRTGTLLANTLQHR